MKLRNAGTLVWILAIAASIVLGAGRTADAALLGVQIAVQLDTGGGFVTAGTALGGAAGASTPLDVTASTGNTLRFIVQFDDPSAAVNAYGTSITTDDPTEMDFVNGSAVELSGAAFAAFGANPNNSLNDATPAAGNGNRGGSSTFASQQMYRVDFAVTGPVTDALRDFTINLTTIGSGNTLNTAAREASVRVNAGIVPEPSTMLLLGGGLAALAGFARRKR